MAGVYSLCGDGAAAKGFPGLDAMEDDEQDPVSDRIYFVFLLFCSSCFFLFQSHLGAREMRGGDGQREIIHCAHIATLHPLPMHACAGAPPASPWTLRPTTGENKKKNIFASGGGRPSVLPAFWPVARARPPCVPGALHFPAASGKAASCKK